MSYRVLHVLDCFLPQTMNWFESLLEESSGACEHHIFTPYYIKTLNGNFRYVNWGIKSSYPIPLFNRLVSIFIHPFQYEILQQYVDKHKIQLIHFHFGHVALKYKTWIEKSQLPFCISLYGFDYEYLVHKNPSVKSDYALFAGLGGSFIVEGNYSRQLIHSYGIPLNKVYKVHMLFDRHQSSKTLHYSQPIKLFQAATFTEKKNQLGLIEALQKKHESKFVISFYGEKHDVNYFREVEKAIKKKPGHTIRIHDKISMQNYLDAMSQSHYTVNLSRRTKLHDTEGGCPVLLKDSLSIGKPVISTRHCDIPELVANGFNGFLIPENDPKAVVEILDYLLTLSQKQYNAYCRNAVESVKTNISQKISSTELVNVYESML